VASNVEGAFDGYVYGTATLLVPSGESNIIGFIDLSPPTAGWIAKSIPKSTLGTSGQERTKRRPRPTDVLLGGQGQETGELFLK